MLKASVKINRILTARSLLARALISSQISGTRLRIKTARAIVGTVRSGTGLRFIGNSLTCGGGKGDVVIQTVKYAAISTPKATVSITSPQRFPHQSGAWVSSRVEGRWETSIALIGSFSSEVISCPPSTLARVRGYVDRPPPLRG